MSEKLVLQIVVDPSDSISAVKRTDDATKAAFKQMQDAARTFGRVASAMMKKTESKGKKKASGIEQAFKLAFSAMGMSAKTYAFQTARHWINATQRIVKEVINLSMAFETGMAGVASVMDNDMLPTLGAIRDELVKISTEGDQSLKTLSGALKLALSSGIASLEQAKAITKQADIMATAAETSTTVAMRGLISVANAYKDTVGSTTRASDIFFMTQKLGATNVKELTEQLGKVSSMAASAGVSFSEVNAAVAAVTKTGENTSRAVTGLRAMIAKIIKPSEASKIVFQKLGISYGALALKAKGLSGVLAEIREKTGGNVTVLHQLFGRLKAAQTATVLAGGSFKDFNTILGKLQNSVGATREAYEKFEQTWKFASDNFRNILEAIYVDAANKAFGNTTTLLRGINEWLRDNKDKIVSYGAKVFKAFDSLVSILVSVGGAFQTAGRHWDKLMFLFRSGLKLSLGPVYWAFKLLKDSAYTLYKALTLSGDAQRKHISGTVSYLSKARKQILKDGESFTKEVARQGKLRTHAEGEYRARIAELAKRQGSLTKLEAFELKTLIKAMNDGNKERARTVARQKSQLAASKELALQNKKIAADRAKEAQKQRERDQRSQDVIARRLAKQYEQMMRQEALEKKRMERASKKQLAGIGLAIDITSAPLEGIEAQAQKLAEHQKKIQDAAQVKLDALMATKDRGTLLSIMLGAPEKIKAQYGKMLAALSKTASDLKSSMLSAFSGDTLGRIAIWWGQFTGLGVKAANSLVQQVESSVNTLVAGLGQAWSNMWAGIVNGQKTQNVLAGLLDMLSTMAAAWGSYLAGLAVTYLAQFNWAGAALAGVASGVMFGVSGLLKGGAGLVGGSAGTGGASAATTVPREPQQERLTGSSRAGREGAVYNYYAVSSAPWRKSSREDDFREFDAWERTERRSTGLQPEMQAVRIGGRR